MRYRLIANHYQMISESFIIINKKINAQGNHEIFCGAEYVVTKKEQLFQIGYFFGLGLPLPLLYSMPHPQATASITHRNSKKFHPVSI